jgi:hypothetical protein
VGYDNVRATAKREEIARLLSDGIAGAGVLDGGQAAAATLSIFAEVTAPYYEPEHMQLMTMSPGGTSGGSSVKPGNIRLNLGKLVRAIASGTLTIVGAMAAPWTLVIGALITWDSLWSCLNLDLTEQHASVIYAMWLARDDRATVAKSDVVRLVNTERVARGTQPLSYQEISRVINDLNAMRCIQQSKTDESRWWLREWVRIQYG